ncbi:hypothetical protein, partial [Rhizobium leguminosarum]|uniref:hypothetical protein n=1 Tax=Rhizobium leguminosarum TaxID=384 RepID=UPI003F99EF2F
MMKKSKDSPTAQSTTSGAQSKINDAEIFVKRLTELGYFKYADPKDVDTLQKLLINSYDPT